MNKITAKPSSAVLRILPLLEGHLTVDMWLAIARPNLLLLLS